MLAVLTLHLAIPGCRSLKEKRGRLTPLLFRLRREFNVSVAEMACQEAWKEAVVACAMVGNEREHLFSSLQVVAGWVAAHWDEGEVLADSIEVI